MFTFDSTVETLSHNPASEVEVELETFEDNKVDNTQLAKATGRSFRMVEAVKPSESNALSLYVRRIDFEPIVGGAK